MPARKVGSVVGDDSMRKLEVKNDVLPKELHYLLSYDLEEWHRLYPLGEVVGGYQEEPELWQNLQERAHHIEPPLHKGSEAPKSVKDFTRPVGERSEPYIMGTSSCVPWHRRTSWASSTPDCLVWARDHPPVSFSQSSCISGITLLASSDPKHLKYGSEYTLE